MRSVACRLFTVLLLVAGAFFGTSPLAGAVPSHVQASLVAADSSIQPGQSFTVALRFVHDPHWHTYWLNPGTGIPTSLKWTLPPGFTAGEIQWPAPKVLKDRAGTTVMGNGYEGELFLPVTLRAPADLPPGSSFELKARADWLVCEDVCIPGRADVTLTLAVSATAPTPNPQWGAKIRATVAGLPRSDPSWQVTAAKEEKSLVLQVTPVGATGHSPRGLHFFSDTSLVAYELPQVAKSDGKGGYVLTVPISPDGPRDAPKLLGVLTSENGWSSDGALRGLRVHTVFGTISPGAANLSTGGAQAALSTTPVAQPAAASVVGTLLLAFVGGLILNLMPCVFPVLGIKILGFVNQSGQEKSKVVAHGLVFALGVLVSFWSLAGALAALRAGGAKIGWGFQLQSPAFVFALAAIMLVFALNLSGVFEFGLRATGVGSNLQTKTGFAGSFFTGVLATVVATPCSAPFLSVALGAALTVSTVESFGIFTAIALGLALPYLLLSIFPAAIKMLPRPGAWMETFKQFMAFPLYATVAYLLWVLAAQTSEEGLQNVFFGLVLVALGVWIYGRWTAPGASTGRVRFGVLGLVTFVALGAWMGWPQRWAATPTGAGSVQEVVWEKWSPDAVTKLQAEGRIVYVDFTARWCATCQANKKLVFRSDEVLKYFAEKKIVTLRADWTNQDAAITEELAKYNRSAVPFNQVWFPGKVEPLILPELLTPNIVLEALRKG